jgi:hypothetical protein
MRGFLMTFETLMLVTGLSVMAAADGLEAGGVEFEPTISVTAGESEYELRCTGTALRKKYFFKVYAVAGYLDAAVPAGDDPGATFIEADAPKRLHLHMLRDVDSDKIVESIDEAFEKCATMPLDSIEAERARFREAFSMEKLLKGQDIRFTWIPGSGLQISVDHESLDTIENPAFARAFFEIYFGPKPVNDGMKEDLLELES